MNFLLDQDLRRPVGISLVFLKSLGVGVLYLRILASTQNAVHAELRRALEHYSEEDLVRAFVVIEPDDHRIQRLPAEGQEAEKEPHILARALTHF